MARKSVIITIDGGGACGKSTLAGLLAHKLNYIHLDTGAIYRSIALFLDRQNLSPDSAPDLLAEHLQNLNLRFPCNNSGGFQVELLSATKVPEDLSLSIRAPKISELASAFATLAIIRNRAIELQQKFAREHWGIVADGRDMGTVVFPEATIKFFLSASVEIRAQRRYEELRNQGITASLTEVLEELKIRDQRDKERSLSPLIPAKDAIIIDNSHIDLDTQLTMMLAKISDKIKAND